MSKNVLEIAEFIYTHPELGYLKPEVWRIHQRLECGQESGISSFKVLKRHSTLVKTKPIHDGSKYNLYGSAQIKEAETLIDQGITKLKVKQIKKIIFDLSSLVDDLEME